MNPVKKVTVYLPIDVHDRLPENSMRSFVFTKSKGITSNKRATLYDLKWVDDSIDDGEKVTHWLEKQENQILLSEEAARKLLSDVWDAATTKEHERNQYLHYEDTGDEKYKSLPDKDTFINNLLK